MMKQSLDEKLRKALAFNDYYKFPQMELVPDWAVSYVRYKAITMYSENSVQNDIFFDSSQASAFVKKAIIENSETRESLAGLANEFNSYSAIFREKTLHIFKGIKILEEDGDVMIEEIESLDKILSVIFHKHWRQDSAILYTGICFEWEVLHLLKEPLVVRTSEIYLSKINEICFS